MNKLIVFLFFKELIILENYLFILNSKLLIFMKHTFIHTKTERENDIKEPHKEI